MKPWLTKLQISVGDGKIISKSKRKKEWAEFKSKLKKFKSGIALNRQNKSFLNCQERLVFYCITNTTGYARGSKKLVAMNRKKEPPMIK